MLIAKSNPYYLPRDIGSLLRLLGIEPASIRPLMGERVRLCCGNDDECRGAVSALERISVGGKPVFFSCLDGHDLVVWCQLPSLDASTRVARDCETILPGITFGEAFYKLDGGKLTEHSSTSFFCIQTGRHMAHAEAGSLLDILPTIGQCMGLPTLGRGLTGHTLLETTLKN